jgi:hypothetical protein
MQGQDEDLHRFWRGLALVELWGPRPWVPPYPGPRDIKASAGARWGAGGVSARAKAIWKGILQPGATQTRDGAGPLASLIHTKGGGVKVFRLPQDGGPLQGAGQGRGPLGVPWDWP